MRGSRKRIEFIDLVRGLSVIAMILFNYSVTLKIFGLMDFDGWFYWHVFPRIIGFFFIFISGLSASVSFRRRKGGFGLRYVRRGLKLSVIAMMITIVTFLTLRYGFILFGIIHFLAFSSFVIPMIPKMGRKTAMTLGVVFFVFGVYLNMLKFDFPYLFWLGFIHKDFYTFDYFPVFPWIGAVFLGFGMEKFITNCTKNIKNIPLISWLGKNSLAIYLLHQPLLVGLLLLFGFNANVLAFG